MSLTRVISINSIFQNENFLSRKNYLDNEILQKRECDYFKSDSKEDEMVFYFNPKFTVKSITNLYSYGDFHGNMQKSSNFRKYSSPLSEHSHPHCNLHKMKLKDEMKESLLIKKNLLIEQIKNVRKNAINTIIKKLRIYSCKLKFKQFLFQKRLREILNENIVRIQKFVRRFLIYKHIFKTLWIENHYLLLYESDHNKNKDNKINIIPEIKLKVHEKENTIYSMKYSKILKKHFITFPKKGLIRSKYKVNFIINDKIVIDPNFGVDRVGDKFYNVLETKTLKFKKGKKSKNVNELLLKPLEELKIAKKSSYEIESSKIWEKIFEIKIEAMKRRKHLKETNSLSENSEMVSSGIEEILINSSPVQLSSNFKLGIINVKQPKSILKKSQKSDNFFQTNPEKRVSFSDKIFVCS
jgi:hypothetical protein